MVSRSLGIAAAAVLHKRGHAGSIMQVNSNHAAAARKHLVRQLYMSGVRPNIICTLYTCNLIPAHVRDTRSQAGVHLTSDMLFAILSRAVHYCRLSSLLLSRIPTPPCSTASAASFSAAAASLSDTTPHGLMALKGVLAAAGSAQRGEQ